MSRALGMIRFVALVWHRRHFGPGAVAYDGQLLVGQVARYDERVQPGTGEIVGHFYVGFVRGHT